MALPAAVSALVRWLDPPWRQRREKGSQIKAWAALAAAFGCYLLAFLYIGPSAGTAVTVLYALPCVMAGWAFGASGGLMVALLTAPVHAWLFQTGAVPPAVQGALPAYLGIASALVVGTTVGQARDLRERLRERTAELAASEDRYRQLVDNSPEGVLVHERGVVLFANPSFARLVGAPTPDALAGRTLVTLTPFEDREAFAMNFIHAPLSGPTSVEVRFAHSDGRVSRVVMTAMPIDHQGRRATLVLVREKAVAARAARAQAPTSAPERADPEALETVW